MRYSIKKCEDPAPGRRGVQGPHRGPDSDAGAPDRHGAGATGRQGGTGGGRM